MVKDEEGFEVSLLCLPVFPAVSRWCLLLSTFLFLFLYPWGLLVCPVPSLYPWRIPTLFYAWKLYCGSKGAMSQSFIVGQGWHKQRLSWGVRVTWMPSSFWLQQMYFGGERLTRSHFGALAVLELSMWTRLTFNSELLLLLPPECWVLELRLCTTMPCKRIIPH